MRMIWILALKELRDGLRNRFMTLEVMQGKYMEEN